MAKALLERASIDYFTAYVCENLGARDERVTRGTLAEIADAEVRPAQRDDPGPRPERARPAARSGRPPAVRQPGRSVPAIEAEAGLLTPAEVRAIALAQMDIAPSSIVWDIGAGSGSVSIEAAQMASDGSVYAIEMDAEDHGLIRENAERFGVANVNAVLGRAPEAFDELPDPDAVFIAGAGREVTRISRSRLHPPPPRRPPGRQHHEHRPPLPNCGRRSASTRRTSTSG